MDLKEIETYVHSRVGAVFSEEHAEKIVKMLQEFSKSLVGPGKPATGPGPPTSDKPGKPTKSSD